MALKNLGNDLCRNTVAITEKWLNEKDYLKTWGVSPKSHECFRYDGKCLDKTKDGHFVLYIPCKMESKQFPELNLSYMEKLESIWVEIKQPNLASNKNITLLNVP